ncbi:MAG: DUF2088 domain-containing protein [Candidatus Latescibacteria bacterium]|nr:DUF2088 domain-containing protein [Candidatus Latescibacterota bacterium]
MATCQISWTQGPLGLEIPDQQLQARIQAPKLPELGEPRQLVQRALEQPIGSRPLKEALKSGDKVALLITDTMDRLMGPPHNIGPYLLDELNRAGVPDSHITVVHAAGMHGHAGAAEHLGEEWLRRVRYVEHHPGREEGLRFVGTTKIGTPVWVNKELAEADFALGVGGCSPSLFGFHGGAGIVLPGAAGRDTIRHNHAYVLMDRSIAGWGPGNPQREDVQDAGDLAGFDLKVDFTANTAFAGYHREEWPVAVKYCQQQAMTLVEPGDIYILGIGTSPNLGSLYMHIEAAQQATREGGIVIALISAHQQPDPSGWSEARALQQTLDSTDAWMEDSGDQVRSGEAHQLDLVARFRLMQCSLPRLAQILSRREGEARSTCMAWSHRRAIERRRTFLVSDLDPEQALSYGFARGFGSFAEAFGQARTELGSQARVIVNAPLGGFPLLEQNRVA